MEVILLEKVENLGNLGDLVTVKPGYARNYLVPSGKAKFATPENIAAFETQRAKLEVTAAEALTKAQERKAILEAQEYTIIAKAGNEGKLFGSIGPSDIARVVTQAGVELEKREVRMPTGTFRQVGDYEIGIHLHTDIDTKINLKIVVEE